MWNPVVISASILGMTLAGQVMAQGAPQTGLLSDSTAKAAQDDRPAVPFFIAEQGRDQLLATSLLGARVVDIGDDEIGSVRDVILDAHGNAIGIVVRWGGVLGLGGKDVAISFGPAQVHNVGMPDRMIVRVTVPRAAIEAGPEFMDAEDRDTEAAGANPPPGAGQP